MGKYGLTPNGVTIKRLDLIQDEIHDELTRRWGVNTRNDPQSLLGVIIGITADRIAELWELGQDTYYAMYPSTAEGQHLDNAVQFGGITRGMPRRTHYPIHCTGIDGTVMGTGTRLESDTNPAIPLVLLDTRTLSRSSFNAVTVKVAAVQPSAAYTVSIDNTLYSITSPPEASEIIILQALCDAITTDTVTASVDGEAALLKINAANPQSGHVLLLSENLTTSTVTTVITFATESYGEVALPDGVITTIVKGPSGLHAVENRCGYIAGNLKETDPELRQSYADKIFNTSSYMIESIRSAILANVQGVRSVAGYENMEDELDSMGRPPHSIEMVVDGGDDTEIAQQILAAKGGGINTHGDVIIELPGNYGEMIPIRFNRPSELYIWYRIVLTPSKTEAMPPNYADLVKSVILSAAAQAGANVVPQKYMSRIYETVSGIDYVDITLFSTENSGEVPVEYLERSVEVSARTKAVTSESRIEVVLQSG